MATRTTTIKDRYRVKYKQPNDKPLPDVVNYMQSRHDLHDLDSGGKDEKQEINNKLGCV